LAVGDDFAWVDGFGVDQILVGGVGVFVQAQLAGRAFAVAVAAVFEGEDVGGGIAEEFVGRCRGWAILEALAVEGQEGELAWSLGIHQAWSFVLSRRISQTSGWKIAGVQLLRGGQGSWTKIRWDSKRRIAHEGDYVGDQDG